MQGFPHPRLEIAAGFRDVFPAALAQPAEGYVMEGCEHATACLRGLSHGIFVKGDVPAIVQAVLNAPMIARARQ